MTLKHGRGRYKEASIEQLSDLRELEILVMSAERAWSHALQLKSDNAVRQFSARVRQHSIRKLHKAMLWACKLDMLSKTYLLLKLSLCFRFELMDEFTDKR